MEAIEQASGERWTAYNGDSCEVLKAIPDRSVHLSVFSPPFASLYTYSASPRDLGNSRDHGQFFEHFGFIVKQLRRVMVPGRIIAFHCMLMPTSKERDGYIGLRDFRGELIRLFQEHDFIYHSEACIWKDPVTAMQRTKALGLLHKTVRTNASMSRMGIPDYLVAMRVPGEIDVKHSADSYPVGYWQRIASPIWSDINPSDTLQYRSAREGADERHICPLQLEVILRAIQLWTNPNDVVLSPFMGIGSEGFVALGGATMSGKTLAEPRRFVGVELKSSYYRQAVANLSAVENVKQSTLF
jgi:DNA modification methylase